jgi:hypothetical protein
MKPNNNSYTYTGMRLFAVTALVTALAFAPGAVLAAGKDTHKERVEQRITDMHTKLKITSAEEDQWAKVVQVMRDNAKTMDTLTQARAEHAKDLTAVEDLKSYGEIAEAHADGIKKLTPVFADLYAGMSDAQKKEADTLFRHGPRRHHGHMRSESK